MRKIVFLVFLSIIIFAGDFTVRAAFDLENNKATYDPNRGLLTIYNDFSNDGDYSVDFSKIKLSGNSIKGTYRFEKTQLKIYINNKDIINKQEEYIKEGTILKNLVLEKGAIVRSYRPPNSINIVMTFPSNEKILDTNIIALKPKMIINSFKSNVNTLSAEEGGKVIFYVDGVNLKNCDFEIINPNSTTRYKMNVTDLQASVSINIPPNYLGKDIIMEYNLYCNNAITDKKVSITMTTKQIIKEDDSSIKPDNDSNDDNQNIKPDNDSNDDKTNIKPDNNLDNNNTNIKDDSNNNDNIDNEIKNDESSTDDTANSEDNDSNISLDINTDKKANNKFYILGIILIFIGSLIYFLIKIKNKKIIGVKQ